MIKKQQHRQAPNRQVPIIELLKKYADLKVELQSMKEWFANALSDPKNHPRLQDDYGWAYFIFFYEWLGGDKGAREMTE
jgi:hypothetical protein